MELSELQTTADSVCAVSQPWFIQQELHSTHMMKGADSASETHANNSQRHSQLHGLQPKPIRQLSINTDTLLTARYTHSRGRQSLPLQQPDQLSPLDKVFFQNQQHILNTHFLHHFAVYCLYCKSLQRLLPSLHYHFNVYCLYCTITSPCTAFTVQSLRRVVPLLYKNCNVYCLYCTITSTFIAFTVLSLQRVLSLL